MKNVMKWGVVLLCLFCGSTLFAGLFNINGVFKKTEAYARITNIAIVDMEMQNAFASGGFYTSTFVIGGDPNKLVNQDLQNQVVLSLFYDSMRNGLLANSKFNILSYREIADNPSFTNLGTPKGYVNMFTGDNTEVLLSGLRGFFDDKKSVAAACQALNVDGVLVSRITFTKGEVGNVTLPKFTFIVNMYLYDRNGDIVVEATGIADTEQFNQYLQKEKANDEIATRQYMATMMNGIANVYNKIIEARNKAWESVGVYVIGDTVYSVTNRETVQTNYRSLADQRRLNMMIDREFETILRNGRFTPADIEKNQKYAESIICIKNDFNKMSTVIVDMIEKEKVKK